MVKAARCTADGACLRRAHPASRRAVEVVALIPGAHFPQHGEREHRGDPKPGEARLAVGNDDPGSEQRPRRAAGVAADLEYRLRQAMATAGGETRDARGFGMKDGRARTDQGRRREDARIIRRPRQDEEAGQRESHAGAQRVACRMLVGVDADDRLQHRRAHLVGESYGADLREAEVEAALQQGIDGDDQRLDHVVEKMRETNRSEHVEAGLFSQGCPAGRRRCCPCAYPTSKKLFDP